MSRRFVTKTDIDAIADAGDTVLEVDAHTTVTDLAREHAMRRGVTVRTASSPASGTSAATDAGAATDQDERLRAAVRSSVLAAMGEVPAGLDAALDKVLGSSQPR